MLATPKPVTTQSPDISFQEILNSYQLVDKPSVLKQFNIGTTLHRKLVKEGLLPSSISMGGPRSLFFLQHEYDQVLAFFVAEKSECEIRTLVSSLAEQRKLVADGVC